MWVNILYNVLLLLFAKGLCCWNISRTHSMAMALLFFGPSPWVVSAKQHPHLAMTDCKFAWREVQHWFTTLTLSQGSKMQTVFCKYFCSNVPHGCDCFIDAKTQVMTKFQNSWKFPESPQQISSWAQQRSRFSQGST